MLFLLSGVFCLTKDLKFNLSVFPYWKAGKDKVCGQMKRVSTPSQEASPDLGAGQQS